jgi:hypothetical protein
MDRVGSRRGTAVVIFSSLINGTAFDEQSGHAIIGADVEAFSHTSRSRARMLKAKDVVKRQEAVLRMKHNAGSSCISQCRAGKGDEISVAGLAQQLLFPGTVDGSGSCQNMY